MKIEAKMRELGLRFPPLGAPGGLYAFARRTGNLVYVSGQTPDLGGVLQIKGVVGKDIDIPTAQKAAELAALNILAVLKVELGDLIRCHTNFRHPFNLSWSGKTCDIRRSSKTTS